jgi:hypothetical protein
MKPEGCSRRGATALPSHVTELARRGQAATPTIDFTSYARAHANPRLPGQVRLDPADLEPPKIPYQEGTQMRNKAWLQWVACAVGFAALALGTWRAISVDGEAGLTALIVVSVALVLAPLIMPRLTGLSVGTDGFRFSLTQDLAESGAVRSARLLDHTELAELAEAYGVIHQELSGEHMKARIHLQDTLVDRAAMFAKQHRFDPAEIRDAFGVAAPMTRVLLLGLVKGDPRLIDAAMLASAIKRPATGNEQYQALTLAKQHWNRFDTPDRELLVAAAHRAPIDAKAIDSQMLAGDLTGLIFA